MADPGADQSREQDREHHRPGGGEEAEADADLALESEQHQKQNGAHAPGDVARAPREGGLRRAEPNGVDAVDLVVGADPHCPITR